MTRNIYFHNGGFWSMPHYIGAINELVKNKEKNFIYYGNSAGASWALVCYLVLNGFLPYESMRPKVYKVFEKKRPISTVLTPIYCDLIDIMTPYWPSDLSKLVSGILNVGVSTKYGHKFINTFNTNCDLYNALLCSGTIAGLSNYESVIDSELCLDGGYMFNINLVPKNTMIIESDTWELFSLTCPPSSITPLLENNGRRNVKYGLNNPVHCHNFGTTYMNVMFKIHELFYKEPMWKRHIKKRCKRSDCKRSDCKRSDCKRSDCKRRDCNQDINNDTIDKSI